MDLTAFNSMPKVARVDTKAVAAKRARRDSVAVLTDARREVSELKQSQADLEAELLNIRLKESDNILEGVQQDDLEAALHELQEEAAAAMAAEEQSARALMMVTNRAAKRAEQGSLVGVGRHKANIDVSCKVDSHNTARAHASQGAACSPFNKPLGALGNKPSMLAMLNQEAQQQAEGLPPAARSPAGSHSGSFCQAPLSPNRLQHGRTASSFIGSSVYMDDISNDAPYHTTHSTRSARSVSELRAPSQSHSSPLPQLPLQPRLAGAQPLSKARRSSMQLLQNLDEAALAASQLVQPSFSSGKSSSGMSSLLGGAGALQSQHSDGAGGRGALAALLVPSKLPAHTADGHTSMLEKRASGGAGGRGDGILHLSDSKLPLASPKAGRRAGRLTDNPAGAAKAS